MISETGCSSLDFQRGRVWREGTQFTNIYPAHMTTSLLRENMQKPHTAILASLSCLSNKQMCGHQESPWKRKRRPEFGTGAGQRPTPCQLHSDMCIPHLLAEGQEMSQMRELSSICRWREKFLLPRHWGVPRRHWHPEVSDHAAEQQGWPGPEALGIEISWDWSHLPWVHCPWRSLHLGFACSKVSQLPNRKDSLAPRWKMFHTLQATLRE